MVINIHNSSKEDSLVKYIYSKLDNYFNFFIQLIRFIDTSPFYIIIEKIFAEIKIEQRNLLFECLKCLYEKFKNKFLKKKEANNDLFPRIFFKIIIKFLEGINKINISNKTEIEQFNNFFQQLINDIIIRNESDYYDDIISVTQEYIKALDTINDLSSKILKYILSIIEKEKCTSIACYNFVSTFLHYLKNNISANLNKEDLFNEIILIIQKSYTFTDEYFLSSKFYALLLTLQILNLNPNINIDTLSFLLNSCIDCFIINTFEEEVTNGITKNEEDSENIYPDEEIYCINQLCLANICLGFIYKPELTYEILNNKYDEINKKSNLDKFFYYISCYSNITYPIYNIYLGKCVILGICNIIVNNIFKKYLDNNKEKKIFLLKLLLKMVEKSKDEKNYIVRNSIKDALEINFVEVNKVNNEESEIEDENIKENISDFHRNVEKSLYEDNNYIANCDEFKYFKNVIKCVKENDNLIYNLMMKDFSNDKINIVEEMCKLKNIKIFYKNEKFIVARKI